MKNDRISQNVILTGFTSFFTDVSSEMIYPLLQAFIRMLLSAKASMLGPALGIVEGIAESTASILKLFSGYYSDRIKNRKMPAIFGYSTSAISKLLLFLSGSGWHFILLYRFFDRVGKGIRSAPRDALISESVSGSIQGKAFGFQRGMDFAGATLGVLICYFLSRYYLDPITGNLRNINAFFILFLISVIPAFIGVVFLFFVKEIKKKQPEVFQRQAKPKPELNISKYERNLKLLFLSQLFFTLGNSSNQFLLLRSMDIGHSLSNVILMYLFFNLSCSSLSPFFGSLSDKIGRKKVLIAGYSLYTIVYLSFGFINCGTKNFLWIFWAIYGIYSAMTDGVEKAFVSDLAPYGSKATALGFFHTITGIGLLPASIAAGFLFLWLPSAPFFFGGIMALIAIIILGIFVKDRTCG